MDKSVTLEAPLCRVPPPECPSPYPSLSKCVIECAFNFFIVKYIINPEYHGVTKYNQDQQNYRLEFISTIKYYSKTTHTEL